MDFINRYGKAALIILALIGVYRIADIVMGVMANVFYIDIGFSKEEIAAVSKTFGLFMTIADNLSQGLANAAFIAYLSGLTDISFTAMQYAIFSSIMTLFPKIVAGFSGSVVDSIGYSAFFIGTAIIGIPVLYLVVLAGKITPVQKKDSTGGSATSD